MNPTQNTQTTMQKLIVPLSIVVAGVLIAGAIYMTQTKTTPSVADALNKVTAPKEVTIAPITDNDHILGKKNAKVVLVVYSDTECPYCKVYDSTVNTLFAQYGKDNTLAVVYRHFPLEIHPKARKEAEATECANELGGNKIFWDYLTEVYKTTTSNNTLDAAQLPVIADKVGLDVTKFNTCLSSGKYASKVEEQYQDAIKAGGQGTPYSVLVVGGKNIPLVDGQGNGLGALPLSQMKAVIEQFAK